MSPAPCDYGSDTASCRAPTEMPEVLCGDRARWWEVGSQPLSKAASEACSSAEPGRVCLCRVPVGSPLPSQCRPLGSLWQPDEASPLGGALSPLSLSLCHPRTQGHSVGTGQTWVMILGVGVGSQVLPTALQDPHGSGSPLTLLRPHWPLAVPAPWGWRAPDPRVCVSSPRGSNV